MIVFACSKARLPPGQVVQHDAISQLLDTPTILLELAIVLLVLQFFLHSKLSLRWLFLVPSGAMLLVHPYWTIPTNEGDCGFDMTMMSCLVVLIQLVLVSVPILYTWWMGVENRPEREDYGDLYAAESD